MMSKKIFLVNFLLKKNFILESILFSLRKPVFLILYQEIVPREIVDRNGRFIGVYFLTMENIQNFRHFPIFHFNDKIS